MTPKEKAKELIDKFINLYKEIQLELAKKHWAKQSALIAADDIIKETKLHDKTIYQHGRTFYWEEVKQEIEKL